MAESPPEAEFERQFRGDSKDVFREIVAEDIEHGGNAVNQAYAYAERGKPEFALAYLLVAALPDDERRSLYARAYQRRAEVTEERAREFDHTFHRSFAMLFTEAGKDRAAAKRILAGRSPKSGVGRQLPIL